MHVARRSLGSLATLIAIACSTTSEPPAPRAVDALLTHGPDRRYSASGFGLVDLSSVAGATDAFFEFNAQVNRNGSVSGRFFQRRARNGLTVDFAGFVSCLTIDAALGRARIGGVITRNSSTDPAFLTDNHEVGDDVWFRVEDGSIAGAVDASTTYGFKPTLVNTSAEYCALPFTGSAWNPASTFPLRSGNITVRP
ncbi:MAG: hypothetical protein H7066_09995 [Cytophagaceae bacterium]|nr:hypothetical protein [Gemmatimonadaceae bacterium]